MQNINFSHHWAAEKTWTSGGVYDLLCRVRMYYVPAVRDEWGALRPTPAPGRMHPGTPRSAPTIYSTRTKKLRR